MCIVNTGKFIFKSNVQQKFVQNSAVQLTLVFLQSKFSIHVYQREVISIPHMQPTQTFLHLLSFLLHFPLPASPLGAAEGEDNSPAIALPPRSRKWTSSIVKQSRETLKDAEFGNYSRLVFREKFPCRTFTNNSSPLRKLAAAPRGPAISTTDSVHHFLRLLRFNAF